MKTKPMPRSQMQMYCMARDKIAKENQAFMEAINDPVNPMTDRDLKALIARRPQVWGRFSGFLGKLGNPQ